MLNGDGHLGQAAMIPEKVKEKKHKISGTVGFVLSGTNHSGITLIQNLTIDFIDEEITPMAGLFFGAEG